MLYECILTLPDGLVVLADLGVMLVHAHLGFALLCLTLDFVEALFLEPSVLCELSLALC